MNLVSVILERCYKYEAENYPLKPMILIGKNEIDNIKEELQLVKAMSNVEDFMEEDYYFTLCGYKCEKGSFDYGFIIIERND